MRARNTRGRVWVAGTGVVLLDSSLEPVYVSTEAVKLLTYGEEQQETRIKSLGNSLREKIRAVLGDCGGSSPNPSPMEIMSGKRRYLCRVFSLQPETVEEVSPTIGVVIERNLRASAKLSQIAEQFRLAPREREAVELLTEGLSGKEIANRMKISPNTVKALLRLVMLKMGASSRAGIIAKLLQSGD